MDLNRPVMQVSERTKGILWIVCGVLGQLVSVPFLVFLSAFGLDAPGASPLRAYAIGWVVSGGPVWVLAVVRGVRILRRVVRGRTAGP